MRRTLAANRRALASSRSSSVARGKRFVIVASGFNPEISRGLIRGATDVLRRAGASDAQIRLIWAPGAFELPVIASRLAAQARQPDAIIALGALIRGQTPQYQVIAHAVAQGLSQVSVQRQIPVTFGVIVANTLAQAKARADGTNGNRGAEAAMAALAVLRLFKAMS